MNPMVYRCSASSKTQPPVFKTMVVSVKVPPSNTASRHATEPFAANADLGSTTPMAPPARQVSQKRQQNALYKSGSPVPIPGNGPATRTRRIASASTRAPSYSLTRSRRDALSERISVFCSLDDSPLRPGNRTAQKPSSSTVASSQGGLPKMQSNPGRARRKTSGNATGKWRGRIHRNGSGHLCRGCQLHDVVLGDALRQRYPSAAVCGDQVKEEPERAQPARAPRHGGMAARTISTSATVASLTVASRRRAVLDRSRNPVIWPPNIEGAVGASRANT